MVLLLPLTIEPVNWLSSRGMLRGRSAWDAGVMWAAFFAALAPTLIASRLERRPIATYGLSWRPPFALRFWEGVAWGLGAVALLMALLAATRAVTFARVPLSPETLRFAAVWAMTMLAFALFEQYSTRGYLQFTLGGSMGFWRAAVLLSFLFAVEDLLAPSRRGVLRFAGSVGYALFFCFTLRRSGSLWLAVGLQFAWGWAMVFLFGMPTPLSRPEPPGAVLHPAIQGPDWLTGGKYGPDGSVLTLVVIALLWLAISRSCSRSSGSGS